MTHTPYTVNILNDILNGSSDSYEKLITPLHGFLTEFNDFLYGTTEVSYLSIFMCALSCSYLLLMIFCFSNDDTRSASLDQDQDWDDWDKDTPVTVIGITGRKRSGKDTIGEYLVEHHDFTRIAFADTLKEVCKLVFGFSNEQVYGDLKEVMDENWNHTPREILQIVGTELFRETLPKHCSNISNDIWIKSVKLQMKKLHEQGQTRFVITDIRFPNEIDFVTSNKCYKGISWKVQRPSLLNELTDISTHSSEILIDNLTCDHTFINDKTIKDLHAAVEHEICDILRYEPADEEDEEEDEEAEDGAEEANDKTN